MVGLRSACALPEPGSPVHVIPVPLVLQRERVVGLSGICVGRVGGLSTTSRGARGRHGWLPPRQRDTRLCDSGSEVPLSDGTAAVRKAVAAMRLTAINHNTRIPDSKSPLRAEGRGDNPRHLASTRYSTMRACGLFARIRSHLCSTCCTACGCRTRRRVSWGGGSKRALGCACDTTGAGGVTGVAATAWCCCTGAALRGVAHRRMHAQTRAHAQTPKQAQAHTLDSAAALAEPHVCKSAARTNERTNNG